MALFRLLLAAALTPSCRAAISRESILREQDLRVQDSALLRRAASSPVAQTRQQALLAMGRIQAQAYIKPLLKGLSDPAVAEPAAFSAGQLGLAEPELSSATLRPVAVALAVFARGVRGPAQRAAVEALGKVGGPEEEPGLVALLASEQAAVRGEAALALFRQRFLKRVPEYSTAAVTDLTGLFSDSEPEVRWRAVYAFSRFSEPRAATALSNAVADPDARVRFFACRALALLKKGAPLKNLAKALADPEYLVRTEAVRAVGLAGRADLLRDEIFSDPSIHVRAAAADALAATADPKLAHRLDALMADPSPMVKGEALLAWPKLRPKKALELLDRERSAHSWWVRSRAYQALGDVPGSEPLLKEGVKDLDQRVASAALEALAKSSSTAVADILDAVLRDPKASLELMGTAVEAAGERESVRLYEALAVAHAGELAKSNPELGADIFEAMSKMRQTRPELAQHAVPVAWSSRKEPSPYIGKPFAPVTVVLETDKGDIALTLAVKEAPLHAASFLNSVRKGLYDGTIWHRVVSGFVAQGGDPRGSGWGDGGVSLRDEINRVPFERGTLGMPKAGKDTGGCQLFITYAPTPHLDGRYTVFGKVVSGLDIVDRLEPGDRIRRAYAK